MSNVVRVITRHLEQDISLPYDPSTPLEDQCAKYFIDKLYNVPSDWGILHRRELKSLSIEDTVYPKSYGPNVFITARVSVSYETLGFRVGDVLFRVKLQEPENDTAPISKYIKVKMVGLPFNIYVETTTKAELMNIIIHRVRKHGKIIYIAKPAFYPHYLGGHLVASIADETLRSEQFYSEPTKWPFYKSYGIEPLLLHPLARETKQVQMQYIVRDIRKALTITETAIGFKGQHCNLLVNGKALPKYRLTKPNERYHVIIDFLSLSDLEHAREIIEKADVPSYDFVYVMSFPLFQEVIAVVLWKDPRLGKANPTLQQLKVFSRAVIEYINMKKTEADSYKYMYSKETMRDPFKSKEPDAALVRQHLEARLSVLQLGKSTTSLKSTPTIGPPATPIKKAIVSVPPRLGVISRLRRESERLYNKK